MEGFSVNCWEGKTFEGELLSGKEMGSFSKIRHRVKYLWVTVNGKKVFAPGHGGNAYLEFGVIKSIDINLGNNGMKFNSDRVKITAKFKNKVVTRVIDMNGEHVDTVENVR